MRRFSSYFYRIIIGIIQALFPWSQKVTNSVLHTLIKNFGFLHPKQSVRQFLRKFRNFNPKFRILEFSPKLRVFNPKFRVFLFLQKLHKNVFPAMYQPFLIVSPKKWFLTYRNFGCRNRDFLLPKLRVFQIITKFLPKFRLSGNRTISRSFGRKKITVYRYVKKHVKIEFSH